MCLTPKIIISSEFVKSHNRFNLLCMNGRTEPLYINPCDFFPYKTLSYRSYGVNKDNIDNYYALNAVTGEMLNVYQLVPCRKCVECRNQHLTELYNRMLLEESTHKFRSLFFTLTYSDENLPKDGVSIQDMRLFFNRFYTYLRRVGYSGPTPRHIYFAEYAPDTFRPHYHGLIFGLDVFSCWRYFLDFTKFFHDTWGKGHTHIKHFEPCGYKYIAKYLLKPKIEKPGLNPIFWFGSRVGGGIGSPVLNDHNFIDAVNKHNSTFRFPIKIHDQIYTVTVPKFLRDKIYSPLSKCLPSEVKSAILNINFTLHKMHRLLELYPDYEVYLSRFDFVFPPELVDKFPSHSYIAEYGSTPYDLIPDDILIGVTPKMLIADFNQNYDILCNFVRSDKYSKYLDMSLHRSLYLSSFHNHVQKYIDSLPPENDRFVMLQSELNKVKQRHHIC